ncbi:MAG: hypothetical protein ABFC89_11725 [Methanospirillum sp.]
MGGVFPRIALAHYGGLGAAVLGPHLLANALVLREPFFVFGWLG